MHDSPQWSQSSGYRHSTRQPFGDASTRFACRSTSTPSRSSTGSISSWKPLETTCTSQPAGLRPLDELAEAGADSSVLEHPAHDLLERRGHRRELPRDHLAKRHRARVEAVLDLLVDDGVAEVARDRVEQVVLGHGPVEVDHDRPAHRRTFVTIPSPTRALFLSTIESGRRLGVPESSWRCSPRGGTSPRPDPGRTCASRQAPRTTSRRTARRPAPSRASTASAGGTCRT